MKPPKIVALLPIKANSERVRGKNFRVFHGRPLFHWMLETLLSLDELEKVIINTDARDLLIENGLIENERVVIRHRSKELCGDTVSMNRILEDDVCHVPADLYLMTHTTNPLLSAGSIKAALKYFQEAQSQSKADSLFTVNRIQARVYQKDGQPVNHDPNKLICTQNLDPLFEENSNLYIFTESSFRATRARIGKQPIMFESQKFDSIDIDTQDDWDFAVILADYLKKKAGFNEG